MLNYDFEDSEYIDSSDITPIYLVIHDDGQAVMYNKLPTSVMDAIDYNEEYTGELYDITFPESTLQYECGEWNFVPNVNEIPLH